MVATRELVYPAQPVISAGGRVIASPFQFVTRGDDHLRIISANMNAVVELRIAGRRYSDTGEVLPIDFRHTPNTDRTTKTENFALGAGAILNLTVSVSSGTPLIGQTFVILQLIQGLASSAIVVGTILSGYVTATQPRAFPGSLIESSIEGPGALRRITGADPVAGAEIAEIVPTNTRYELHAMSMTLVTDGTAINRAPTLTFDDGAGAVYMRSPNANTQTAGQTRDYTWAAGLMASAVVNANSQARPAGIPTPSVLLAGHRIRTVTETLQAGDNWGAPTYTVREWLEV